MGNGEGVPDQATRTCAPDRFLASCEPLPRSRSRSTHYTTFSLHRILAEEKSGIHKSDCACNAAYLRRRRTRITSLYCSPVRLATFYCRAGTWSVDACLRPLSHYNAIACGAEARIS